MHPDLALEVSSGRFFFADFGYPYHDAARKSAILRSLRSTGRAHEIFLEKSSNCEKKKTANFYAVALHFRFRFWQLRNLFRDSGKNAID